MKDERLGLRPRVPCPHCGKEYGAGAGLSKHLKSCSKNPENQGLSSSPSMSEDLILSGHNHLSTDWLLWDRGTWRGWAVGSVSRRSPRITTINTPHLGKLVWDSSALAQDVEEGRVFFTEPQQILKMIITQIDHIDLNVSEYLVDGAIDSLTEAIKWLEAIKNEQQG